MLYGNSLLRRAEQIRRKPRCGFRWPGREHDHRKHTCKRPRRHPSKLHVCACGATFKEKP